MSWYTPVRSGACGLSGRLYVLERLVMEETRVWDAVVYTNLEPALSLDYLQSEAAIAAW